MGLMWRWGSEGVWVYLGRLGNVAGGLGRSWKVGVDIGRSREVGVDRGRSREFQNMRIDLGRYWKVGGGQGRSGEVGGSRGRSGKVDGDLKRFVEIVEDGKSWDDKGMSSQEEVGEVGEVGREQGTLWEVG